MAKSIVLQYDLGTVLGHAHKGNILFGQLLLTANGIEGNCTKFYSNQDGSFVVEYMAPNGLKMSRSYDDKMIFSSLSGNVIDL